MKELMKIHDKMRGHGVPLMKAVATVFLAIGMQKSMAQILTIDPPVQYVTGGAGSTTFTVTTDISDSDLTVMVEGEWTTVLDIPRNSIRRRSHALVVFDNKLWLTGGNRDSFRQKGAVSSVDGIDWDAFSSSTQWSAREEHTSVVFDNKIWVIGGYDDDGTNYQNDVWYGEDSGSGSGGLSWTRATNEMDGAAWPARSEHTSVVFGGKMWVIGGYDGTDRLNDVWSSSDGANWTQATANASWPVRSEHTSVVFGGKIWVIGGSNATPMDDVWSSSDGTTWMQATNDASWTERREHTSVVYDDKIWVIGGDTGLTNSDFNDVWYSEDGAVWTRAMFNVPWSARSDHASVVYNGKLWVVAGATGSNDQDDVFSLEQGWLSASQSGGTLTATYQEGGTIQRTSTIIVSGSGQTETVMVEQDGIAPTVTINQASSQEDPTNENPVFDVVFSEPVTGFEASVTSSTGPGTLSGTVAEVAPTDGTTYTLTVTGMTGDGTVTASIPADAATDAAGNGNVASTSTDNTVAYDGTSPTVTINQGSSQSDITNIASMVFDVVFSEQVTGFEASVTSSTGPGTLSGTVAEVAPTDGTTYTLTVTGMTGDGVVTASIPAGVAVDAVGNLSEASTSTDNTVVYDITAPTVTIEQGSTQDDPTNVASVVFDVVFSEPVTGFTGSDVRYIGTTTPGAPTGMIMGSGSDYTLTITGITGDGAVMASILANAATDEAGNDNVASTSTDNRVAYDGTAPTVTINQSSGQPDLTNVGPVAYDIVFSEPVTGFEDSDVDLAASTVAGTLSGTVTGSGTDYTLMVTGMTGTGEVIASIPAGVATDAAGNGNEVSTSTDNSVDYDGTPPTVTIEQGSTQGDPTNVASVVFDVTFSEPVTGFEASDVDLTDSTVPGTLIGTITGSGTNYTLTVTEMTGDGNVVASISANAATDAAGNSSETSTSTDNTVAYDITAPTVTIEQGSTQNDPTNVASVVFDVTFSEPVTGFEASDVDLAASTVGGTLSGTVTGSGTDYTLMVTGMTGTGEVIASIPAGVATDAAGNGNEVSTSTDNSVDYDGTPPTVTIEQGSTQGDPTNVASVVFDVTFSEPVTGFEASDVDLTDSTVPGTLIGTITGSGTNYTLTVTEMTGDGNVVASISANAATDAAGNSSETSTSTDNTVVYDITAPTVTIEQGSTQDDPTNVASVVFDVTFSEPVTGFEASDVNLAASTVAGTLTGTVTGSGTDYTLTVTGMTGTGVVEASIPAGVATDAAGNLSEESTSTDNTVAYDGIAPTVTIEQGRTQDDPTNVASVAFDVTFSEPVTGFEASDVSYTASTVGGTLAGTVTGSGTDYTLTVTGMTGDGVVVASIPANAATDAASNGNEESTNTDNTVAYDGIAPTVTINQGGSQNDLTNVASVVFDVTFSEPVTGFEASDVSYTASTVSGTLSGSVAESDPPGDGTTYTLTVTGMTGDGNVVASISANAATDAAGNSSETSTSTDNLVAYDGIAPTVTINQGGSQNDLTNVASVVFDVTFSEPVTGFEASDVSYTASTVGGTLAGTITGSGTDYTLTVTGMTGTGVVEASIPAGVATDVAGNGNVASTSADNSVDYDGTNPTVIVEQGSMQNDPTNMGPVVFDVTFSEPVTGFEASDVDLAASTVSGTLTGTVTGAGTNYALMVTGMMGTGEVTASIPVNAATDAAGNLSEASTSTDNTVVYDITAPTVTIEQGSSQDDPTNMASVVFDVVFSEPVTGFEASDVSYAGSTVSGTLTGTITGAGTNYALMVTGMTGTGEIVASVPAGVAVNAAGSGNVASTSTDNTVEYDVTAPTVTIEQGSNQDDPTNVASVVFDVTFSEPVTGFEASDVNLAASTVAGTLTGTLTEVAPTDGITYTLTVTGMTGDGRVTASIPADVATDAAGNLSEASTSTDNTVEYDVTAPTVTIEQGSTQEDPTNVASVVFDVTFSEPVTGFEASDVSYTASTVAGTLTGTVTEVAPTDGITYTLTVTGMTGTGVVEASIPAGVATDAAGNGNVVSTSTDNTVAYDGSAPTVTIEQGRTQEDPTNVASVVFDVVFSEPVTGFEASDVSYTASTVGGTLAGTVMGFGTDYTLTVTGMTGDGEVTASIPAGVATDAAGSGNVVSTSTDNTVAYDGIAPTVTIEQGRTQDDPTNVASVVFDVTFSEPVTGFEASDVNLAASTVAGTLSGTVTGSGTDYTLTVTGMTGDGEATASIPAGVATDAAGNLSEASTSTDNTVAYDGIAPTVTIEQGRTQDDPTNVASVAFDVTFSEPVTGFEASDVNLAASTVAGTLSGTVTGSGTDYTLTVTGMTGDGEVTASIPAGIATDAAGNGNEASTSTDNTVAYTTTPPDTTPPTVTIDQGSNQEDPTNEDQVVFDVVFSEPVTGFEASDVDLTASTVPGTLTGTVAEVAPTDGTTYTLTVTGMSGDGVVEASIPADVATDAAGNGNEASTSTDNTVAYTTTPPDTTPPTVTIDQGSNQEDPTNEDQVVFDVVFSEPVTGFEASDVDLTASTVPGTLTGTVAEVAPTDGTTYTLTVTGMSGDGVVEASIPADVATDAAGNGNVASTSTDNTVDYKEPLGIESPAHLTIYPNPGSAQVTVDFGEITKGEGKEWMLLDPSGKKVRSGAVARGEATLVINTQGLLSGLYLFQARGEGQKSYVSKRVVIRH